jgi:hypothetical protein
MADACRLGLTCNRLLMCDTKTLLFLQCQWHHFDCILGRFSCSCWAGGVAGSMMQRAHAGSPLSVMRDLLQQAQHVYTLSYECMYGCLKGRAGVPFCGVGAPLVLTVQYMTVYRA